MRADMSKIRNKSAYFSGVVSRFKEDGCESNFFFSHKNSYVNTLMYSASFTLLFACERVLSLYGVATSSRLLKNIGLPCERAL